MFEIGKQVVCIAHFPGGWVNYDNVRFKGPVLKQVVTIKEIKKYTKPNTLGLQFFEIGDALPSGPLYYDCKWFRPVKDTSIECFRHHLAKTPKESVEVSRVTP